MYTKKLLTILFLNYLPIFVWILLFHKGSLILLLLIPLNILIMTLDYFLSYSLKELRTAYINLIIANTVGSVLQAFLLKKYPMEKSYSALSMLIHILFFSVLILIGMLVLKKPMRIKKKKIDEKFAKEREDFNKYMAEHIDDEDKDPDQDYDEDDDEYNKSRGYDNAEDTNIDNDDDDNEIEESDSENDDDDKD